MKLVSAGGQVEGGSGQDRVVKEGSLDHRTPSHQFTTELKVALVDLVQISIESALLWYRGQTLYW